MNIQIEIPGLKNVSKMLQLADVTISKDWALVWKGFIRPTPCPGISANVVDPRFTLEDSTQEAFDNSGANVYAGAWAGYGAEPKYSKMKSKAGGGTSILVWQGSADPLRDAFRKGKGDHIEGVSGLSMFWGAKGRKGGIAARLSQGGFYQPWDKTSNTPARPVIRLNESAALEVARGMQRVLRGRLGRAGFAAARREP